MERLHLYINGSQNLLPHKIIIFYILSILADNKHFMTFKIVHQDQIYIEGLANNNSEVIARIYKKFAPKVTCYIKMNSGSEDQAQDVIQEVLIAMYNQAKTKGLELTCPFDAFFFYCVKGDGLTN